jgi:hypothetical protein
MFGKKKKEKLSGKTKSKEQQQEDALETALRDSFPSSDPISISEPAAKEKPPPRPSHPAQDARH